MAVAPTFTKADIAELYRVNVWLDRMPRVRMQTWLGRAAAHCVVLVLTALLAPSVRRLGVSIETRSVFALGRRVSIRILRPPGPLNGVHLDIHGGGWCAGNAAMDDLPNARLALACGVAVASVEYGHAPKNSVRGIIGQCESAAIWLADNATREFKTNRLTIGGESAGAHLALCTLLKRPRLFQAALLYYGIYDLSGSPSLCLAAPDTLVFHAPTLLPSLYALTPGMNGIERRSPDISPAFADLEGAPPALIIAAGGDPLGSESETLAARWHTANRKAKLLVVPDAPHAFNRLPIAIARKTEAYAHAWLKDYFAAASQ